MTNEEARDILVGMRCTEWMSGQKSEALDCAIVALQQTETAWKSMGKYYDAVNELCYKCGKYKEEYLGACDGCRWKDER